MIHVTVNYRQLDGLAGRSNFDVNVETWRRRELVKKTIVFMNKPSWNNIHKDALKSTATKKTSRDAVNTFSVKM